MPLYLITVTVLFITFACSTSQEDLDNLTIYEVAKLIEQEIGDAKAESVESCDFMPIGVKPAGGPWGYIVFSTDHSDKNRLESLVEKYNELDALRNEGENGFSTADFATEPDIVVENGACKGVGLYTWNPGDIINQAGLSDEN